MRTLTPPLTYQVCQPSSSDLLVLPLEVTTAQKKHLRSL